MTEIRSFAEANRALRGFMSEARSPGQAYTLERMRALMEFLGNPQNSYRVVHIAGTSGKTSTSYFVAALLNQTGRKLGLTVSPHVDEINERVQINGRPLPEREYCAEFTVFLDKVHKSGLKPTYFELLVAFAYWEFARQKVDYAVVEVGLGGLLDGTNVITRADKVCVITDIGLDHIEVLGKTLPEITAQKTGIIQPGNQVFTYDQGEEVMAVIRKACADRRAELVVVKSLEHDSLAERLPLFQQRNWRLAYDVASHIIREQGLSEFDDGQLASSMKTYIPARMETVAWHGKTLILDGAHNAQKLAALAESIREAYPNQPVAVMASFVDTKKANVRLSLKVLAALCDHIILTTFATADQERVSMDIDELTNQAAALGIEPFEAVPDPREAFSKLVARPESLLLVTGSFFLLNHVRPTIRHAKVKI